LFLFKWTALHYAAQQGNIDVVKKLINLGAESQSMTIKVKIVIIGGLLFI